MTNTTAAPVEVNELERNGPVEYRVFGAPGTGKTTTLAKYVQSSIRKFGSEAVMIASFTKTAAVEIASRGLSMDKNRVGTLHSFAFRALGHPSIAEKGKAIKSWNQRAIPDWRLTGEGRGSLDDPWAPDAGGKTEGDKLLSQLSRNRTRLDPRETWDADVLQFEEAWKAWKEEDGFLDFTDLIEFCVEREIPPPVSAHVGYFDEVQDFSPLELRLVRQWAQTMAFVVLAGDDDQTIYQFRGSIPDAFLDPPIPDEHRIILPKSYRLPEKIKDAAERWVKKVQRRQEKVVAPKQDSHGAIVEGAIDACPATWNFPDDMVSDAIDQADAGKTVMILAACGYMLENTLRELRLRGAPFHNPYRVTQGNWNPMRGGAGRLAAFHAPDIRVNPAAQSHTWESTWSWLDHLSTKETPLKRGAKKLCRERAKDDEWKNQPLTVDDFTERLGMTDLPGRGDIEWLDKRIRSKMRPQWAYAFQVCRTWKHGAKALFEEPKITIGTIHSVKGGESDVVYIFPDLPFAAHVARGESLDEADAIRRQFYVGMTRASERLVICNPADHERYADLLDA